jgi:UDP-N-acetylmuramoyl-tripeptide--D-alanyl-D-alanine ligase
MSRFADPFFGYSLVLRTIIYVVVPAFTAWQFVRFRRALHVFQLEGYRRKRFLAWCKRNRRRALFLHSGVAKKPLVMTGRAWRTLSLATLLSLAAVLVPPGLAHVAGGWPFDIPTWAAMTALVFAGAPYVIVASDWLLTPVQKAINARYLSAARRKLAKRNPVVIGVTGSFGKTSTKFAIGRLLGSGDEVLVTPDSYNTPLGVCRTINERLRPSHTHFVVEMGAYHEGEIAELCRFVRPSVGVLTSIGPAHLERFGSLDAIRRAKYEIVQSLPLDGVAVMNVDDEEVRSLADRTSNVRVVRYGLDASDRPDVTARDVRSTALGTRLTIVDGRGGESLAVETRLLGKHALGHLLAAVAVATSQGARLADLRTPIEELTPAEHRLQLIESPGGVTIIDDAYNSNPEGAAAALEVLDSIAGRKKVVVTPGIIELGELQFEANERFGEQAARTADAVIVVARVNREAMLSGAARADGAATVITVDSLDQAQDELRRLVEAGDVILFENDLPDQYER